MRDTSKFRPVQDLVKSVQAVDCVTLDGDQASNKGVLTGGYMGQNSDKYALYQNRELARQVILVFYSSLNCTE